MRARRHKSTRGSFQLWPLHWFTFTCFARRRFHSHAKLRSDFFLTSLQLILIMNEKYAIADLHNWRKV